MKLSELRPCDNCGGPFKGAMFYVVRFSLAFVAPQAGNQVLGLTQILGGNLAVAEAMAPDAQAVKIAGDENPELMHELLICSDCMLMNGLELGHLAEKRTEAAAAGRRNVSFQASELAILVYWMTERDRIRFLKESGTPRPWTTDPLLRDYRWCNVRRMDDRVSRWLLEHWYIHNPDHEYQLVDATLARLINWPDTLAEMTHARDPEEARIILHFRAGRGEKVFTGAYVVPGVPGKSKVDSVCDLAQFVNKHACDLLADTMQATWYALMNVDGLGSFLAGQIVADLAEINAGYEWADRESWAPIGPGSARGINRLLGRPKDQAVKQAEFEQLLPALITELQPRVADLWRDRALIAMDIQNCLCEFDKYRRLTLGEGKVRARYDGGGTGGSADVLDLPNFHPQRSLI